MPIVGAVTYVIILMFGLGTLSVVNDGTEIKAAETTIETSGETNLTFLGHQKACEGKVSAFVSKCK